MSTISRSSAKRRFGLTDKDLISVEGITENSYLLHSIEQLVVQKYGLQGVHQIPDQENLIALKKKERKELKEQLASQQLLVEEQDKKRELAYLLSKQGVVLAYEDLHINHAETLEETCFRYCKNKYLREHEKYPKALEIAHNLIAQRDKIEPYETRWKLDLPWDWRRHAKYPERLAQIILLEKLNHKLPKRWPWL